MVPRTKLEKVPNHNVSCDPSWIQMQKVPYRKKGDEQ